jgi:hypothetical protein
MKFERLDTWGFEHALRGMRNPMNSWDKSDSDYYDNIYDANSNSYVRRFVIGENDMKLAQKLIRAGSVHRKFMRQIFVSVDITAPLYWWKEFDTYKVGTVANSTSTMHKLASTQITKECFEHGDMIYQGTIAELEMNRLKYLESKDMNEWKKLIVNLPESWLQTRTVTMSYENLLNMFRHRHNHKLTEWHQFCEWIKTLPYAEELICE